jgi:hypothetical protein
MQNTEAEATKIKVIVEKESSKEGIGKGEREKHTVQGSNGHGRVERRGEASLDVLGTALLRF